MNWLLLDLNSCTYLNATISTLHVMSHTLLLQNTDSHTLYSHLDLILSTPKEQYQVAHSHFRKNKWWAKFLRNQQVQFIKAMGVLQETRSMSLGVSSACASWGWSCRWTQPHTSGSGSPWRWCASTGVPWGWCWRRSPARSAGTCTGRYPGDAVGDTPGCGGMTSPGHTGDTWLGLTTDLGHLWGAPTPWCHLLQSALFSPWQGWGLPLGDGMAELAYCGQ